MDYKKIKLLLIKFFNGETSLEEEKYIQNFFNRDDIPLEFENERNLFNSLKRIKVESEPDSKINEELVDLIEQKWNKFTKNKFQKILKWSVSAAACLLVGVSLYYYQTQKTPEIKDTFTDQQQAYDATKQVLLYISQTMNTETSKLSSLATINESLTTMTKLEKINNTINNYKTKEK